MNGVKPAFVRSVMWGALWVALDGFVVGTITASLVCAGYALFYALPCALTARENKERRNYYLMRAGVFALVPVLVVLAMWMNLSIGERNADTVVAAIGKFRVEQRRYPKSLQELTPRYLPEIPRTSIAIMDQGFRYLPAGDKATLMYVTVPPFGRRVYDFDQRRWHALD